MPQPTVYDYILFRGSDIKDIRVVNSVPIPNDPAIMQMQMNQQPGFPPQQMQPGPMGAGQFGPFGNIQGQGPPPMGQQSVPPPQQQQQNQVQSPQQVQTSQTQSSPQQQQQPLSQQQGNNIINTSTSTQHSKKASDLLSKIDLTFPSNNNASPSSDKLTSNPQSTPNSLTNEIRKFNINNNSNNIKKQGVLSPDYFSFFLFYLNFLFHQHDHSLAFHKIIIFLAC